jgi:NAD+-dependent protein deacetylase SIR2
MWGLTPPTSQYIIGITTLTDISLHISIFLQTTPYFSRKYTLLLADAPYLLLVSECLRQSTATIGRRHRDKHGSKPPKSGRGIPRRQARKMGQEESSLVSDKVSPVTLTERTLSGVAEYIKSGKANRIVVMTGAGISTAAGIPDFRSPGTGLYANLARLNLPYAEAVFDISYFRDKPEPFYVLARELYPGKFHPTVSHAFIALLAGKSMLQMLFTQNIDCLEREAGVPGDKIVEAHGSFATQRCIECKTEYPGDKMREHVEAGKVPRCEDEACKGLVKPDIVFFGEPLPKDFDRNAHHTYLADLVLVLGTSLSVYPFAQLPEMVKAEKPRVLFNMERVGNMGSRPDDVLVLGECDDGVRRLADELGWREELEDLWVGIVGEKEAARQRATSKKHQEEIEDEVAKLAEGVEAALNFEEASEKSAKGAAVEETTQDVVSKQSTQSQKPVLPGAGEVATVEKADDAPIDHGKLPTDTATHEDSNKKAVEGDKAESSETKMPLDPEVKKAVL